MDHSWSTGLSGTRTPPPIHRASTTGDADGSFSFTLTDLSDEASSVISVQCGGSETQLSVIAGTPTPPLWPRLRRAAAPPTAHCPGTGTDGATRLAQIGFATFVVSGVATYTARRAAHARFEGSG